MEISSADNSALNYGLAIDMRIGVAPHNTTLRLAVFLDDDGDNNSSCDSPITILNITYVILFVLLCCCVVAPPAVLATNLNFTIVFDKTGINRLSSIRFLFIDRNDNRDENSEQEES